MQNTDKLEKEVKKLKCNHNFVFTMCGGGWKGERKCVCPFTITVIFCPDDQILKTTFRAKLNGISECFTFFIF